MPQVMKTIALFRNLLLTVTSPHVGEVALKTINFLWWTSAISMFSTM